MKQQAGNRKSAFPGNPNHNPNPNPKLPIRHGQAISPLKIRPFWLQVSPFLPATFN